MLTRRDLVGKLAAGTAVLWAAGAAHAGIRTAERSNGATASEPAHVVPEPPADPGQQATESAPVPWELVQPLAPGAEVAHGWHLAGFSGAVGGSCVVTLQNARGRSHRIHLCRNDGQPMGLVYTEHLDLVVMNGGAGDLPTEEGFAQAVAALARVLAANEARHVPIVTALLPHGERLRRFADAGHRLR